MTDNTEDTQKDAGYGVVVQFAKQTRRGWIRDSQTLRNHFFEHPATSGYLPKKGTYVSYTKKYRSKEDLSVFECCQLTQEG